MIRIWILVFALLCTVGLTVYAHVFDGSEFRGLAFTMGHMIFFTPALLILPLAVHIRPPPQIRTTLRLLNALVIIGLIVSWVVLMQR